MKLTYMLAEPTRRAHFVATGETLSHEQAVELPADALDAALRAYVVARTGRPALPAELTLIARWRIDTTYWRVEADFSRAALVLDRVATDDAALDLLRADAARYQAAQAERDAAMASALDARIAALEHERDRLARFDPARADARRDLPAISRWDGVETAYRLDSAFAALPRFAEAQQLAADLTARVRELDAQVRAADAARTAQAEAEKAQRLAERRDWAARYGSQRLRKCEAMEYDCQRLYVTERAAVEFPGYVVDFDDRADWKGRAGPSEAALDEAERVGGSVVWLTTLPLDDGAAEEYQAGWESDGIEAVVIRQYLGRYDLIKIL